MTHGGHTLRYGWVMITDPVGSPRRSTTCQERERERDSNAGGGGDCSVTYPKL